MPMVKPDDFGTNADEPFAKVLTSPPT
jgi:hypothetical protein